MALLHLYLRTNNYKLSSIPADLSDIFVLLQHSVNLFFLTMVSSPTLHIEVMTIKNYIITFHT